FCVTQSSESLTTSIFAKVDCVTQKCLKKLDRADKGIDVEDIKSGMLAFKKEYQGELIIEILFVKGLNDKDIERYSEFLLALEPVRIDIGTIDRPPAYDVEALSYEELLTLAQRFDKTLPIYIASRKNITSTPSSYSSEEILNTLDKRPLSDDDIDILFDNESKKSLQELIKRQKVQKVEKNAIFFYKISKNT
ncbi:MAG: radical SAM protein, partial [Campylobacterota bacterium]|nr:radical SAM protein [Campylobacterota bacterium]